MSGIVRMTANCWGVMGWATGADRAAKVVRSWERQGFEVAIVPVTK